MADVLNTTNRNWTLFWLIVCIAMTVTGALLVIGSMFGA
jgi:paraquat-inducible protein B